MSNKYKLCTVTGHGPMLGQYTRMMGHYYYSKHIIYIISDIIMCMCIHMHGIHYTAVMHVVGSRHTVPNIILIVPLK